MTTYPNPGNIADVPPTPNKVESTWGNAIRDRTVQHFANTSDRDAAIASPVEGQVVYVDSIHSILVYAGATDLWRPPWNLPWGVFTAPTTTGTNGTATSGTTETLDVVLGNYVFTAVANRRYRVVYDGCVLNGSVANDLFTMNIRDGGVSTPTAGSTLIASTEQFCSVIGVNGRVQIAPKNTFTATAGTHTLGVFLVRTNGTGVGTPVGTRELYVEDVGQAGAPS